MAKTPDLRRERREAPRTGGKTVTRRSPDDLEFSIYNPWAKKSEAVAWQSIFGYLVPDLDLDPPSGGENDQPSPQPQDPSNDDDSEGPQPSPETLEQDPEDDDSLGDEDNDPDQPDVEGDRGQSGDDLDLDEDREEDGGEDFDPSEPDGAGTQAEGEDSVSGDSGDPGPSDPDSDSNDNDPDDEPPVCPSLPSVDPSQFGFSPPTDREVTLPGFYYAGCTAEADEEFIREFTSWSDFVSTACDQELYAWQKTGEKHSHEIEWQDNSWAGTKTFADAEEMARWRGWPEGRELLRDSLASIVPHQKPITAYELDMAGAFPVVPVYCAGDPACMMNIETQTDRFSRPIIRIDFNNYVAAQIEPTTIMNRGAAVLSLANTLEMMGYSTELRIIGNARSRADGKNAPAKQIFRYNIIYKQAGEILDLDRAAFALAHPATMRRLVFALVEQHKDLEYTFGAVNYGRIMSQPNDPTSGKPGGAIFIPCPPYNETREQSQAAVEAAAETIINQLFSEAA